MVVGRIDLFTGFVKQWHVVVGSQFSSNITMYKTSKCFVSIVSHCNNKNCWLYFCLIVVSWLNSAFWLAEQPSSPERWRPFFKKKFWWFSYVLKRCFSKVISFYWKFCCWCWWYPWNQEIPSRYAISAEGVFPLHATLHTCTWQTR